MGEASEDTLRFLYNGQYGVQTETNTLYYMRARYYSQDARRFINLDQVKGDLTSMRFCDFLDVFHLSEPRPVPTMLTFITREATSTLMKDFINRRGEKDMDRKQKIEVFIVVFLVIVVLLYYTLPELRSITETIMKMVAVVTLVCVLMKADRLFGGNGGNSYVDTWDNGDDCDCDGDCDCD